MASGEMRFRSRRLSSWLSDASMWLMRLSLAVRPDVSDEEFAAACDRINSRKQCWSNPDETCSHPSFCNGFGCQL